MNESGNASQATGPRFHYVLVATMTAVHFLVALGLQHLAHTYNNPRKTVEPPYRVVALAAKLAPEFHPDLIDPDAWGEMGLRVYRGEGLVDKDGNAIAFRGPVVPLVYASAAALFGPNYNTLLVVQIVFFALSAGVLGLVCDRIFGRRSVTLLFMLMHLAFIPAHPWFCHIFAEPIFTFLLAVFILVWSASLDRRSLAWSFAAGGALILAALARPVLYFFLPLALLFELYHRGLRRDSLKFAAALLCGVLPLQAAWVARNVASVGRPVFLTSGSAQAFYGMTWHQQANWMGNVYHDPERFPPKAQGFWDLPQETRSRKFRQWAWQNIREEPLQVALLVPKRALLFLFQMRPRGWIPTPKSLVVGFVLYGLAIVGYLQMTAELRKRYLPCLLVFLFALVFHSLLRAEYRYSHPFLPYVFMLSSAGLVALAGQWRVGRRDRET